MLSFPFPHAPWRTKRPMRKTIWLLTLCVLPILPAFSQQPSSHFDGQSWWNYVKILAADNMEGRETGSPALRRAEEYVVEQLKNAGLEPAGANGFYQPVQFEQRQIVERDSSLALVHNGQA